MYPINYPFFCRSQTGFITCFVRFSQASVLSFDAQKKVPKKRAVLPATPTTDGHCAVFDRFWFVFRLFPSFFVLSKKALPPALGPSPSVGRASRTACALALDLYWKLKHGANLRIVIKNKIAMFRLSYGKFPGFRPLGFL